MTNFDEQNIKTMSNFSEFDRPLAPQKESGSIISHAWDNYKSIIGYAILFWLISFIIRSVISMLFPGATMGLDFYKELIETTRSGNSEGLKDILMDYQDSGFGSTAFTLLASTVSSIVLYPLSVGLIYITHKNNTKQNIEFSDLFIGYRQNTGNIILYGIVISILASIGTFFCLLPGIYVYIVGFVGLPIVFFGNKNISEGLSLSFNTTNDNFSLVLVVAILGFLISISGYLLCFIGAIVTLPFIHTLSYSLYCSLFGTPFEINKN